MVRQENIKTASTVTRIIPASTINSDHNSIVIVTQNNQPEPISSELINLNKSDTLQKGKNLANSHRHDYSQIQSATEGQGSVDDLQINKLCHSEADKTVLPSKRAETATRLSGNLKSQSDAVQQCNTVQGVPDPCQSVEKLHEFLPDCKKIPGPFQHLQVTQWMEYIDGKGKYDALSIRMEEEQPCTTQASGKQKQFQREKADTTSEQGQRKGT
ncbi:hypothetical protein O181_110042 [Austropuccinia psidii MF-1]|uniref:Uncharacterized protein n=1 Tax=Austropuccinia psidii MF-1 TaxID=1389203 RepID=A0A9Q3JX97_9BASI|nr:hypothetical protein [Austropuccinia psidii MF-1]